MIHLQPGQVERWRIVDSGMRQQMLLQIVPDPAVPTVTLPPINFWEIAVDGLALGKMVETPTIELWPGYRSDVLGQAPKEPGTYLLRDNAEPAVNSINGQDKPLNYVARIVVDGPVVDMKMPTDGEMKDLRLPSIKDSEVTGKQDVSYGIFSNNNNVTFTIDHKSFDMESARELKLNDVDVWTIHSTNGANIGLVTHPFHIHVNPFEVTSIMGPKLDENNQPIYKDCCTLVLEEKLKNGPVWRDTVAIPGGGYVTMRTKYTDFIGTFVQHCHILDHEDQGMMQLIDIYAHQPPATADSRPAINSASPDFNLPDADGKNHSLAETAGQPTVVFFFKGYGCLHCVQQVEAFIEQYDLFAAKGIQVIGVTSDSVDTLKEALRSTPAPFLLLADPDGTAFAKFGCVNVVGLQHGTFALDAGHRVKWRTVGATPYLQVEDLITEVVPRTSMQRAASPGSMASSGDVVSPNLARTLAKGSPSARRTGPE